MTIMPVPESDISHNEAVLLMNLRSLKGEEWKDQAKSKLAEKGIRLSVSKGFTKTEELVKAAKQEAKREQLLIIGGGDGTLNAVATILRGNQATMGVLPLGTGNAFARDLGIPTDLDKAIDIILSGMRAKVDVGLCGQGIFLNVATIGLSVEVAKFLTVPLKRRFGRFVYAIALARAVKQLQPFHAKIQTEKGLTETEALQIVVGNGRYHAGPFPISPTAAITDGLLHLYAVEAKSKAELLKYALLLPTGFVGALSSVHAEDTAGGTITCMPQQSVVIDGEIAPKTPLEFSIDPASLNVMVPNDFKG